jgi:hypothetical protein
MQMVLLKSTEFDAQILHPDMAKQLQTLKVTYICASTASGKYIQVQFI